MNAPIIWLHEEALRITHPVFDAAPEGSKAIFVWDDEYLRQSNYSLKRLIFIYETLCELPIEIIQGDTINVIQTMAPSILYAPNTCHPRIVDLIGKLKLVTNVKLVEDEPFVVIKKPTPLSRFFQYWKKVEKSVFEKNGGTI